MQILFDYFDRIQCLLWIVTYTATLIGTLKYHYPLINPISQAIIAPFEIAVLIRYIIRGQFGFNYVFITYIFWVGLNLLIMYIIKKRHIPEKYGIAYIVLVYVMIMIMFYLVALKNHMFFFSYFNTFIGEVIWFGILFKKDYPMKPFALIAFFAKFIADTIAAPIYWGVGPWLINMICVLLPILDFGFIVVYFIRKRQSTYVSDLPIEGNAG